MLNRLIVGLMPFVPRSIIKLFSKRYIAGEVIDDAIRVCSNLKTTGFETTLDILGESVSTSPEAQQARNNYIHLIETIAQYPISRNISLKPTALGLSLDDQLARENIQAVLEIAQAHDCFVRLDMEDSPYTTKTLELYHELHRNFPRLGVVIQAYFHRSAADVQRVVEADGNLRICKGIYQESASIAFQDREAIRENYLQLVKMMLDGHCYVGIATHDIFLINQLEAYIRDRKIDSAQYEFQALLGVPIESRLAELRDAGHSVRIYVPFGEQWYAYSSRRLRENPDVAGYVLKNLFKRN